MDRNQMKHNYLQNEGTGKRKLVAAIIYMDIGWFASISKVTYIFLI